MASKTGGGKQVSEAQKMDPFAGMSRAYPPEGPGAPQRLEMAGRGMTLETFMAAIRRLESGSFEGNYAAKGRMIRGDYAVGAYQIMSRYWDDWAEAAGIKGASWEDPAAQDHVARHVMGRYFDKLQNWDLVAAAWYAGGSTARRYLENGYSDPSDIRSPGIRQYVEEIAKYSQQATNLKIGTKDLYKAATVDKVPNTWVFPVAGPAEWSGGSYMPNEKTHRDRFHPAIDIYAEAGTPIVAPIRGRVLSTKKSKIGGHTVRMLGQDGVEYYFAHMAEMAVVAAGDIINFGQHLGFVGNSGSASNTKPHLHLSMKKDGRELNPKSWLSAADAAGGMMSRAYQPQKWRDPNEPFGELEKGTPTVEQKWTSALDSQLEIISGKVSGGARDPSIYQNYGQGPALQEGNIDPSDMNPLQGQRVSPDRDVPDLFPPLMTP